MLVIVSWYRDGSGQPDVRFRDIGLHGPKNAIDLLIADIRETEDKECRVYDVGENVSVLYNSTTPEKERK